MTSPDIDLTDIEAKARAATPGPWAWAGTSHDANEWSVGLMDPPMAGEVDQMDTETVADVHVCEGRSGRMADAAFIAACSPDRILALVQRCREAEASRDRHIAFHTEEESRRYAAETRAEAAEAKLEEMRGQFQETRRRMCRAFGVEEGRSWFSLESTLAEMTRQKDAAYNERDRCVALLARMAKALGYRAGLAEHPSEDASWDHDWRTIVFVDLPGGQASWHVHDSERPLFVALNVYDGEWDGHSSEEKYRRVDLTPVINERAEAAESRIAELEARLRDTLEGWTRWTTHSAACEIGANNGYACTCGLDDLHERARAALAEVDDAHR